MKKIIIILVCFVGFTSITSCRSTSNPCGLADNVITESNTSQNKKLLSNRL